MPRPELVDAGAEGDELEDDGDDAVDRLEEEGRERARERAADERDGQVAFGHAEQVEGRLAREDGQEAPAVARVEAVDALLEGRDALQPSFERATAQAPRRSPAQSRGQKPPLAFDGVGR